jgi:CshA-type fibril repeat protein
VTTLTVPGEGVWSVDATTGTITFIPELGFTGDPTPITYISTDASGNPVSPATDKLDN